MCCEHVDYRFPEMRAHSKSCGHAHARRQEIRQIEERGDPGREYVGRVESMHNEGGAVAEGDSSTRFYIGVVVRCLCCRLDALDLIGDCHR